MPSAALAAGRRDVDAVWPDHNPTRFGRYPLIPA